MTKVRIKRPLHPGLVFFDRGLMKTLRKGRSMTLRDLSSLTGISNPYLSQVETGRTTNLSLSVAVVIADAFNLSVDSFVIRRRP